MSFRRIHNVAPSLQCEPGCCIKVLPQGVALPHSCHMEIQVFLQLDPLSVDWIEEHIWRRKNNVFIFCCPMMSHSVTYGDIMGQQPSHSMTGPECSSRTINVACLKVPTGPGLHTLVKVHRDSSRFKNLSLVENDFVGHPADVLCEQMTSTLDLWMMRLFTRIWYVMFGGYNS